MGATSLAGPGVRPPRRFVAELDVLRGFAAALMVLNHAGYALLARSDAVEGASGTAVTLGSYAPVLFFFASGFGMGLGRVDTGRAPALAPTLWKALLLVLADQVMYWSRGEPFGLDFFSFIGLGMVCLAWVARARRPVVLSAALAIAALLLRFGAGPWVRDAGPSDAFIDFALGIRGIAGVSYPLTPWICWALGGFALGCLYRPADARPVRWQWQAALVGAAAIGAGGVLEARGLAPFRWSTMNATFFAFSIGMIAFASIAAKQLAAQLPRAGRRVALGGVASFAVIPLHYALIAVVAPQVAPTSAATYFVVCFGIAAAAWVSAQAFARAAATPAMLARPWVAYACFGVALAVFVVARSAGKFDAQASGAFWAAMLIQLMIAALLGFRRSATAAGRRAGA